MWPFKTVEPTDSYVKYDGTEIQRVGLNRANEVSYVLGNSVCFLRRVRTTGNKLVTDYFQRCDDKGNPFLDAHPHSDYSLLSQEAYNQLLNKFLEARKTGKLLSKSDLEEALKSPNGHGEFVLVHVSRKGEGIIPKPIAKVKVKK